MIEPKVLKGFRDTMPELMMIKKDIIKKLETVFESFGLVPIDTPALEYTEILLGKGGGDTDKQVYRFNDHGGRDVSLRFDLTVPLARFVSQHYGELTFPFKRYHISPVWRGENTQKGRYREFYQCDFDILGSKSSDCEIEILLIIKAGLLCIDLGEFTIMVNNRKILNALMTKLEIKDKSVMVLRTIDKLFKIGPDNVEKELIDIAGITKQNTDKIMDFLNIRNSGTGTTTISGKDIFNTLDKYKSILGIEHSECVVETELIFKTLEKLDILNYYAYNPAITRGLDYYTGVVFETFVKDRMDFGSICSGGRYDNLTELYSKNSVSGIGASFGLDRILSLLEDKNLLKKQGSKTELMIFNLDDSLKADYHNLAEKFRSHNINTEIVFDKQKIANQFKLAEKKNVQFVLFAGTDEIKSGKYNLKNILKGEEINSLSIDDIIKTIKS